MELDLNHFYIETRRHCAFKFPTFMILCETLGLRSLVKNRTKNGGYFINLSSQLLDFINVLQSVQFSSVTELCPALCDPVDCSTPGFPVHHQLPEFAQTHIHRVSDAIQLSHPLPSPSPSTFNLSQHQGLFQ